MEQNLLLLVLMVAAFYFLLIRPQQKRAREQRQLISSISVGDEIVTIGGIFGRVRDLDDSLVWLEITDGTVIRLARGAISRKIYPEEDEAGTAAPDESRPRESSTGDGEITNPE